MNFLFFYTRAGQVLWQRLYDTQRIRGSKNLTAIGGDTVVRYVLYFIASEKTRFQELHVWQRRYGRVTSVQGYSSNLLHITNRLYLFLRRRILA
jgi:hypothetical protein